MDTASRNVYVLHCNPEVADVKSISKEARKALAMPVDAEVDSEPIPDVAKAMHAITLFMSIPRRVALEVIESARRYVCYPCSRFLYYSFYIEPPPPRQVCQENPRH